MLLVLAVLAHDVKSVTAANMALNGGACFLDLQGRQVHYGLAALPEED